MSDKRQYKLVPGQQFNRWKIIRYLNNGIYECVCECGNIGKVKTNCLRNGISRSCGCLHHEEVANWATKHGLSKHPLYKTWHNMRSRCKNPNATKYELYGGRGIKVCEEWDSSFVEFYNWSIKNGWSYGLSIDRIDGNSDYCPRNCRWVTSKVQANNTSQVRYLSYNGKTMGIHAWAEHMGISKKMLSERIRRGWSIEQALTTPNTKER